MPRKTHPSQIETWVTQKEALTHVFLQSSGGATRMVYLGEGLWRDGDLPIPMVPPTQIDWGVLKLDEHPLSNDLGNPPEEVFPYYYVQPELQSKEFVDPIFNVGTLEGAGQGRSFAGGYQSSLTSDMVPTTCILETQGEATISGVAFPADRGVLALIWWPEDDDFLSLSSEDKVVAALHLGYTPSGGGCSCSGGGAAGGTSIFAEGGAGFPSRETGQYSLREIHSGVDIHGNPVNPPGAPANGSTPGSGQVRWGTTFGPLITPYGCPILGAGTEGYSAVIPPDGVTGHRELGQAIVQTAGGIALGEESNFFDYRLPYLKDYINLSRTPSGERARFFTLPPFSAGTLDSAGGYEGFDLDFPAFQMGRFRQTFKLREGGSYWLIHFIDEVDFEGLVVDGMMPEIAYSAVPVNPNAIGDQYLASRNNVKFNDQLGDPSWATFYNHSFSDYSNYLQISGIYYYTPRNFDSGSFELLDEISIHSSGGIVFNPTFRTETPHSMHPVTLSLHAFSYGESPYRLGNPSFYQNISDFRLALEVLPSKLAFPYHKLDGMENFNPTTEIGIHKTLLLLEGDTLEPAFSADAVLHFSWNAPRITNQSHSEIINVDDSSILLFHSTAWDPTNRVGHYGVGNYPELYTPLKDTQERFLDEVYRYLPGFSGLNDYPSQASDCLLGPGMQGWLGGPIEVPVRAGMTSGAGFENSSWTQTNKHQADLSTTDGLQVAGWPRRNPPITEGVKAPFPSSGVLIYPQHDYSSGYRPDNLGQFDYSSCSGLRSYIRCFDVAFSRSGQPEEVNGSSFVYLRILGVEFADIEFSATPPFRPIEVYIKVPGMTAWLDVGRPDGAGPSKYDDNLDGAGCYVASGTFSGIDQDSGLVFTQIKCHVGPNLFLNVGANLLSDVGEAPVLVKVLIPKKIASVKYNGEWDIAQDIHGENHRARDIRVISTIEVLRAPNDE